ncbi:MAG: twin transmembrane helix small protein [Thioalkalispiraceae bacterium]|jgi:hypothetical protein
MKAVILILLLLVVASLFYALFTLVKDKGQTNRTAKALTLRVSLSLLLLIVLFISIKMGYIKRNPHPVLIDQFNDQMKESQN